MFDGKTERKENMVKIPLEVGEAFNAYLNLIFFDLLSIYIYKTEGFEAPTFFHVSTILIFFSFF